MKLHQTLFTLLLSTSVFGACAQGSLDSASFAPRTFDRRGGNGGGRDDRGVARDSKAGLLSEATEHAVRGLVLNDASLRNEIVKADAAFVAGKLDVNVQLTFKNGSVRDIACLAFDDSSRGGTVIKKEYRCLGLADTSGRDTDEDVTTSAGIVNEAVEHSARTLATTNAAALDQIAAALVEVNANGAAVTFDLENQTQLKFDCRVVDHSSRRGTIVKKELLCVAL